MKKRRRIEITTFRRRTAIVLRDRSKADRMRWAEADDEALPQKHAELVRAARSDLDQTQTAISDNAGDLGFKQSRK